MLPVAPIIIIAARIALAASRSAGKGANGAPPGGGGHPPVLPPMGVGDITRGVTWLALFFASVIPELPGWSVWVVGVLTFIPTFPSVTAPVLARLLAPAVAWFPLRLISPYALRGQDAAYAALMILSYARRPLSEARLAWLERNLGPGTLPLFLAVRGALAEARGDDTRARDLFTVLQKLPPVPGLTLARRVAATWLVVRAATRGNWEGVDRISDSPGNDAAVRAMIQHVRAMRGGYPVRPWGRLVEAARWGRVRFAQALAALPPLAPPGPPEAPPAAAPLVRALWWQRRCCFSWATQADLSAAGAAWDILPREPALLAALNARAETLGVRIPPDPDAPADAPPPDPAMAVLSSLWRTVVQQLAQICVVRHVLPPAEGQTLRAVRRLVGEALFKELEHQLVLLGEPSRDAVVEDPVEGWVRFEHVRALADALVHDASATDRAIVFEAVVGRALNFSVWVYNGRGQRVLGHCFMRWLLELGDGVCPPGLYTTLTNNVALGY